MAEPLVGILPRICLLLQQEVVMMLRHQMQRITKTSTTSPALPSPQRVLHAEGLNVGIIAQLQANLPAVGLAGSPVERTHRQCIDECACGAVSGECRGSPLP